jgi:hypothetical protein
MRQKLLSRGYTAIMEQSLQIRRWHSDEGRTIRADIVIGDKQPAPRFGVATSREHQLTVAEMVANVEVEKPYMALAIYQGNADLGEPVAWLELLSPSNKGKGTDAQLYLSKRDLTLMAGIVFVELDYLHESPSTFLRLGDYSVHAANAHPYRIVVLDPRPDFETGPASCKEFDVDDPVPVMTIPLNGPDVLEFDFGAAYQRTFNEMLYGLESVDYNQLPMNFDRYSPADQTRISRRILSVLEAHHAGTDLETGPFPVKDILLDAALEQIAALTKG